MRTAVIVLALVTSGCVSPAPRPVIERYTDPSRAMLNPPYSDAVRAGNLLFLSGKMGNPPGEPAGIAEETKRVLEGIRATLEANGASLDDVVKCTVILADIAEWEAMNAVYRTYFPSNKPARTSFGNAGLVRDGRVEIDCIAVIPAESSR